MSSGRRHGMILMMASALVLSGGVVVAQDPSPSPAASVAPSSSPGASIDPCASPIPSALPSPGVDASASPAGSVAPSALPSPDPAGSPDPTASLDPCASPAPPTSPAPSAEPSTDPVPQRTPRPDRDDPKPVSISLRKVAEGFENPNGLVHAGDDRLFVLEQLGYIEVLKPQPDGSFRKAGIFLDIRDRVVCCGEKGLLGVAFPPDYAQTGRFYVTYAGAGQAWYLDERRVSKDDPDRADPDFRRSLIKEFKPLNYHWGGNMHFGPDGYLWIGMGDGGFGGEPGDPGDPGNRAQDLGTIFGKFLRIDPRDPDGRGGAKYGIPADNPYAKRAGARPEIWLRGVRNPWGWGFDPLTGDLWVPDVGMSTWEEVNRLRAPERGRGANLGWRLMEGYDCYNPASGCERGKDLVLPLVGYRHEVTSGGFQCAITGGRVYRGERSPAMRGWYFFTDYCSGTIFKANAGGRNRQPVDVALDTDLAISAMGQDAAGEIYVLDYTLNKSTAIYRIDGKPKR